MDIKKEDFELNAKEAAAVLATIVLTGLAIGALITMLGKKKDKKDD